MHKPQSNDFRSNGFDGKEAARKLYGGPPEPPPQYADLFGAPALSPESKNDAVPRDEEEEERVPFEASIPFHELRRRCVAAGERYGNPYKQLLSTLRGVEPLARHRAEERRGASYKRLAKAAHMAGFSESERKNLYWIAEKVGMSDRFAGHLVASLKGGGDDR